MKDPKLLPRFFPQKTQQNRGFTVAGMLRLFGGVSKGRGGQPSTRSGTLLQIRAGTEPK